MPRVDRIAQRRRRAVRQATKALKRSARRRAKAAAWKAARLVMADAVVAYTSGFHGAGYDAWDWGGDVGGDG